MSEAKKHLLCRYCGKRAENKLLLGRHTESAHKPKVNCLRHDEPQEKKPHLDYCLKAHVKTTKLKNKMITTPDSSKISSPDNENTLNKVEEAASAIQSDRETTHLEKKLENLKAVLKDKFHLYLHKLRLIFLDNLTQDKFDEEVRDYFSSDTISTHEEFFYEFLKTVHSISPILLPSEDDCRSSIFYNNISEASTSKEGTNCNTSFLDYENLSSHDLDAYFNMQSCGAVSNSFHRKPRPICDDQAVCLPSHDQAFSRQSCLPDLDSTYALTLIHAWENNLNLVDATAVPVLRQSVELYIRRIMMAVLVRKYNFELKDGRFIYNIGQDSHSNNLMNGNHGTPFPHTDSTVSIQDIIDVLKVPSRVSPLESLRILALQRAIIQFSPSDSPLKLLTKKSSVKIS